MAAGHRTIWPGIQESSLMSMTMRSLLVASAFALLAIPARAEPVLTFEGLMNHEPVADYYDGGKGGFGTGPGPNDGITFSSNALALIRATPFPNDPSPPTVLLLGNFGQGPGQPLSMTMDVTDGFSQSLIFYDVVIGRAATIKIYSGLDGGGTMLAQDTIPTGPEAFGPAMTLSFSGNAQSVVFTGGNLQLALDNVTFGAAAVPEPAGWVSLAVGIGCSCLLRPRWRRADATRRASN
jgi:hypothetical protein